MPSSSMKINVLVAKYIVNFKYTYIYVCIVIFRYPSNVYYYFYCLLVLAELSGR